MTRSDTTIVATAFTTESAESAEKLGIGEDPAERLEAERVADGDGRQRSPVATSGVKK